ncbi:sulfatase family protein [Heyndrickxia sp. NPDC080065]|uniref:sulfatase family protein n=1 Tax=Heyndrickxia sp. NPDC080065 TaxID=3390568 RepID=UPI003D049F0B
MKQPNILLITTDSQRWDTLSCMGSSFAISPNLDRLAHEGILFEQGHTSSPVCSPARCSLLTGLHTPIHGCVENGFQRYEHFPTLPDRLKEKGYHNIMVGKTHFGRIPDTFDVQHLVGEKFSNAMDCYGEYIQIHGYNRVSEYPNPIPEELFIESFIVDKTIEEIEKYQLENEKPFFAFCSMISPHEPIDPPGKWAELYEDVELPELNYSEGEIAVLPEQIKALLGFSDYDPGQPLSQEVKIQDLYESHGAILHKGILDKVNQLRKLYYGLAAYCDEQVGKLLRFLDKSGLRENTLVIFTSDHGIQLYDHGFNDKHNYYDASWRVPFIMSMPGTLPSGKREQFAIWNDIAPTILGAAGIQSDTMQGLDLFTPLKQGKPSPRRCAVATLFKSAALATASWKLEYYFDEGKGRLFDRKNDPLERNDLYNSEEYSEIRNELVHALLSWRADIMDLKFYHDSANVFQKQIAVYEEMVKPELKNTIAPVARRATAAINSIKGWEAEERLNQKVDQIEDSRNNHFLEI